MNTYKAIGFDWGGVLVKSKPIMPGIAQILGMPHDELYRFYLQHNHKAGVGSMSYQDLWKFILEELGRTEKIEEVLTHMTEQQTFDLDQEMIELVKALRSDYKVGLLSNNTKENGNNMRKEGLPEYFDTFLISADIGYQKPDPKAFQILIQELEVNPEELIFIDDSTGSLSTAEQVGYTPILFKGFEDLKDNLIKLGVEL